MFFEPLPNIPNQFITQINGVSITIKREDLIHPKVSGNKFRKLKYNVKELIKQKASGILTFGGAYSNHLVAVAVAGKELNIQTYGFVRGEELENKKRNFTLAFCESQGMRLYFMSRADYQLKKKAPVVEDFLKKSPYTYLVPEGGTNELAILGCTEIIQPKDYDFSTICCAVGTGGTLAGLIQNNTKQEFLGFLAVKDPNIKRIINKYAPKSTNWELVETYNCGRYGSVSSDLVEFINSFYKNYKIVLDPLYTAKMVFGIFTLLRNRQWRWGKNILIIHTGGLQGIEGINQRLAKQGRTIIKC